MKYAFIIVLTFFATVWYCETIKEIQIQTFAYSLKGELYLCTNWME